MKTTNLSFVITYDNGVTDKEEPKKSIINATIDYDPHTGYYVITGGTIDGKECKTKKEKESLYYNTNVMIHGMERVMEHKKRIREEAKKLYEMNMDIEDISKRVGLHPDDVKRIVTE